MNTKPHADLFIDDRAINVEVWLQQLPLVRGVIAGAFDIIHPGYVKMFAQAKQACTNLTVALHSDPSMLRQSKLKPVQTVEERSLILKSIRYVDEVVPYDTENDLYDLLKAGSFDVRFLGDDYKNRPITGSDLDIKIRWIDRSHNYSTTNIKRAIHDTIAGKDRR
jgi:glycerol-3-phosphate cytidylyltransferase